MCIIYIDNSLLLSRSDNPGYWLMHCHMEIHNVLGMALVFKEGELEEMPDFQNTLHGLNKTNEKNPDRVHLSESVLPQDSPNSQHLLKDTVIAGFTYTSDFIAITIFDVLIVIQLGPSKNKQIPNAFNCVTRRI